MKCYKCQSENHVRAGFIRGNQRYKCRECGCFFSVEKKSDVKSAEQKRLALQMYLEGLGFRAIGRVLEISYATVYYWVKEWGSPQREAAVEVVKLDEMHSYVGSKKHCWIWIAVDRYSKRFISFVCGSRGRETGMRLYETGLLLY